MPIVEENVQSGDAGRASLANIDRAGETSCDMEPAKLDHLMAARKIAGLTSRQRQIMRLVLSGQPSKIIAADLGISRRTVENHRASIMRRTAARSLPELVLLAVFAETVPIPSPPATNAEVRTRSV